MLVDGAALGRHIAPQSSQRLLQPSPAIDNQEFRLAQLALDEGRRGRRAKPGWSRHPYS